VRRRGSNVLVLTVVDTWSRLCPIIRLYRSATAMEVIDALEHAPQQHGLPITIRVDQGSQSTSKELDLWAYANGITLNFSRPGKPTDNAYVESFNVRPRCASSASAALESGSGRCSAKGGKMAHRVQRNETS
jgi:putative transposase